MQNKQTAVQWLVEQILVEVEDYFNEEYHIDLSKPPKIKYYNAFIDSTDLSEYVNKAIQMEKEQIVKTWYERGNTIVPRYYLKENINGEQYYNETYGK